MSSGNIPSSLPRIVHGAPPNTMPSARQRTDSPDGGPARAAGLFAAIAEKRRGGAPPPPPRRGPIAPMVVDTRTAFIRTRPGDVGRNGRLAIGEHRGVTRDRAGDVAAEGRFTIGGHRANPAAVAIAQENLQAGPPPLTVHVSIPGLEGRREISLAMIPEAMRGAPDIGALLQAKIDRGGEAFRNISSGDVPSYMKPGFTGELNAEQKREKAMAISDMTFFLQAQGEAKVGAFSQGAFSLPDPDGNVLKFLTSYPNAYQRPSSHIADIQNSGRSSNRADPGTEHYGLDLHDDGAHMDTALPNGMKTILFGKIPAEKLSDQSMKVSGDRLFFKMESHGTGGGGVDDALKNPPGQSRGKMQKLGDLIGHAGGYAKSLYNRLFGDNSPVGSFKERIPNSVKRDYKNIIDASRGDPAISSILKRGDVGNASQGIREMLRNIEKAKAEGIDRIRQDPAMNAAFAHFDEAYNGGPEYDHPQIRIGQEIILTSVELNGAVGPEPGLKPMPQAFRNELAALVGRVAGSDEPPSDHPAAGDYFVRDLFRDDNRIGDADTGAKPADLDSVSRFFADSFPDNPDMAAKAMRAATAAGTQLVMNGFGGDVMGADPAGALGGRYTAYPLSASHAKTALHLTDKEGGKFNVHVEIAKRPAAEMSSLENFALTGSNERCTLDPHLSDFRFEYDIEIDPSRDTLDKSIHIGDIRGYEKLYDLSGNIVFQR